MAIQTSYAEESGIPEKYRELYSQSEDGRWVLSGVEGFGETETLNAQLIRERADNAKMRGLFHRIGKKPEEIEAFAAEQEKLRTDLSAAKEQLADYAGRIRKETIEKALRAAASERGIRPEAVSDVLARAGEFEVDKDGRVVARQGDAVQLPAEWLDARLKSSPHWLAPSRSAGAKGFAGAFSKSVSAPATIAEIIRESWKTK